MKKWYTVYVLWADNEFIFDGIQGENPENALENAWDNWQDAFKIDIGAEM